MVINMKKIILLVMILLLVFLFSNKVQDKEIIKIEEEFYHVSLLAVGDNLIHSTIYEAVKSNNNYDFKPIFKEVKPLIRQYDLRFINQETIIGGKELGLSTYPAFNSPYELGDALVDAGFNLISIANNHTLDRGEIAVLNTIRYWDKLPVTYSGALDSSYKSNVKLFNKNGIKFAFVAYTYGTNGIPHPGGKEYLANVYSDQKAKVDIQKIRNIVDVVIVSMHWGEEYQDYPNELQKKQARFLSSLGVDLIIGHHPHVIQPVELINSDSRDTFIIYSLGNFLSDQKGIDRLIGMSVSVDIYKSKLNNRVIIRNHKATLLYRYKNNNEFKIKIFHDLNNEYLSDYIKYFEQKKELIQAFYKDIEVN